MIVMKAGLLQQANSVSVSTLDRLAFFHDHPSLRSRNELLLTQHKYDKVNYIGLNGSSCGWFDLLTLDIFASFLSTTDETTKLIDRSTMLYYWQTLVRRIRFPSCSSQSNKVGLSRRRQQTNSNTYHSKLSYQYLWKPNIQFFRWQ